MRLFSHQNKNVRGVYNDFKFLLSGSEPPKGGGGGHSHMKGAGMLVRNFELLEETNLGVAQAFLNP